MRHKKETIKKIIATMRQNRDLTNDYINPSMIEKKSTEDRSECVEVTYVVEWQMHHKLQDETAKFRYANE